MLAGPASNNSLVGSPSAPQAYESSLPVSPSIKASMFVRMHRIERSKSLPCRARLDGWIVSLGVRVRILCAASVSVLRHRRGAGLTQ